MLATSMAVAPLAAAVHDADVTRRRRAVLALVDTPGPEATDALIDALADPDDEDLLAPDSGWFARFVTSPVALALTGLVVALLVATRDAWGRALGGGLPPAPEIDEPLDIARLSAPPPAAPPPP